SDSNKNKNTKFMLHVIYEFFLYGKDMKSFSDRKELTGWREEINSKSAYLSDGKLVLGKSDYNPDLLNCDLIVLNDFNTDSETEALIRQDQRWQKDLIRYEIGTEGKICYSLNYVQYFNINRTKKKYEIFQFTTINDQIELHLLYDMFEIGQDRKSTRLNSSHVKISYAVFCLK